MSVGAFLEELRRHDIEVGADGERLRCNAPAGVLTAALRDRIRDRKGEIVAFLREAAALAAQQRSIVPLHAPGDRAPVFAVGGHNGDVFCYRGLVEHLGDDQPFFGLEPPGLVAAEPPVGRVEDLAAHFAAQIRAFRPRGPCVIAGYCAGGTIAFELARQIHDQGGDVRLVALFASPHPRWYRFLPQLRHRLLGQLERGARDVRTLARLANAQRGRYVADRWRRHQETRDARRRRESDPDLARRARVEDVTLAAVRRFNPRPFTGRTALLLPSADWLRRGDPLLGHRWRSLAPQLEEYCGPDGCRGDQMLLAPHVGATAGLFRRVRDDSERRPNS